MTVPAGTVVFAESGSGTWLTPAFGWAILVVSVAVTALWVRYLFR